MRLAENWHRIEAKAQESAQLSVEGALQLLAQMDAGETGAESPNHPAAVIEPVTPDELAPLINCLHRGSQQALEQAREHAARAENALRLLAAQLEEAHGRLPPEQFAEWCRAENIDPEVAGLYMEAARSDQPLDAFRKLTAARSLAGGAPQVENAAAGQALPPWLEPLELPGQGWSVAEQVAEIRSFFGEVESERGFTGHEPPVADAMGAWQLLQYIRPEDEPPPFFFLPRPDERPFPDHVVEACRLFDEHVIRRGGPARVWELAATWWACRAHLVPPEARETYVGNLPGLLAAWQLRFFTALVRVVTHLPRELNEDATREEAREWWGYRSDLRHAGVLNAALRLRDEMRDESPGRGTPPNPLDDLHYRALKDATTRRSYPPSTSEICHETLLRKSRLEATGSAG
jgi:hypothetical protein